MSSDDRRSSRLGRDGSFIGAASFYRVRITETGAREQSDLGAFHARGFPLPFMPVAAQVQQSVHHQMRVVGGELLSLRARFPCDDGKIGRASCRERVWS